MKTKLLFTKLNSNKFYCLLALCLCFNYGWSQNLMQNSTCDDWTNTVNDNADAYDMTPPDDIVDNSGTTVSSPYQVVWDNDDLEDWLELFYLGAAGSLDEQPGSTSGGNGGTRGVKLYMDTSPSLPGQSSRRLYQKVEGLTIGNDYVFSVDTRSEAAGTPSEIYILNTEIMDEVGINANGGSDASVDGFLNYTPAVVGDWETSSFTFTATATFAVVYIRSLNSVDGDTEVFYDNFSLVADATASVKDVLALSLQVYPNPASTSLTIKSSQADVDSVELYNILGLRVLETKNLVNDAIDVSKIAKGIYLLRVNSDNASVTKRVVIE